MFSNARRDRTIVLPAALRQSASFIGRSRPFPWFALMPGGYVARYEVHPKHEEQANDYGTWSRGSNYGY